MKVRSAIAWVLLVTTSLDPTSAHAFGKKRKSPPPEPIDGKRVVSLASTPEVSIELPDQSAYALGKDFDARLTSWLLQSGRYLVSDDAPSRPMTMALSLNEKTPPPDFQWSGTFLPTARVAVRIEAMTFQTGSRGSRMIYGFNDRMPQAANDFPLRAGGYAPSWFGTTFDEKGSVPFHSTSGLELGEGFTLDLLFAYLVVKYAHYKSRIRAHVDIESPLAGLREQKDIQVQGKGYFYDVSGAYNGYSLGVRIARKDAMLKATQNTLSGVFQAIDQTLKNYPILGRVDGVVVENGESWVLLGMGSDPQILPGTKFELLETASAVVVESVKSNPSGSIARIVKGRVSEIHPGLVARQIPSTVAPRVLLSAKLAGVSVLNQSSQNIDLPDQNISRAQFPDGAVPYESRSSAKRRALFELIFLPYRIWRYYQYDQAYQKPHVLMAATLMPTAETPLESPIGLTEPDPALADRSLEPVVPLEEDGIRLKQATVEIATGDPVTVAVIDSGVDYNHPWLHAFQWINPVPGIDQNGESDAYGFDFSSGDSRAYDDHYHGTQIASVIVRENPHVRIMPLKVFNPWGITQSSGILAAFDFAVEHGAKIIVCAWDTLLSTYSANQTFELALERAQKHGVMVVASAGDRGLSIDRFPSYPAALSRSFDNVLAVTVVDDADQLYRSAQRSANFGPLSVGLAVRAANIQVAEPRGSKSRMTSTGGAAAKAAAHLAAHVSDQHYLEWKAGLFSEAESLPSLSDRVQEGRRLK